MTPQSLHKKLSERIHEHDIMEILFYAQEQNNVSKALLGAIYDTDVKVARNALWVLTWEQIDKFISERNKFVDIALRTQDATIRRLCLTLLERMPWEESDVRVDLLDFCIERIVSAIEKPGIRSLAIKLAYSQCRYYPELLSELKMVLDDINQQALPPAVVCARRNILKKF